MQVSLYRLAVVVCPPATGPSAGSIGRRLSLSAGQLSLSTVSWPFLPFPPPRDVYVHGHLCWLIVNWPVVSNSYRASMFGAISMRQPAIGSPWLLLSVIYHFSAAGGKRSASCWLSGAIRRLPLFTGRLTLGHHLASRPVAIHRSLLSSCPANHCRHSATILQWPLFGRHSPLFGHRCLAATWPLFGHCRPSAVQPPLLATSRRSFPWMNRFSHIRS